MPAAGYVLKSIQVFVLLYGSLTLGVLLLPGSMILELVSLWRKTCVSFFLPVIVLVALLNTIYNVLVALLNTIYNVLVALLNTIYNVLVLSVFNVFLVVVMLLMSGSMILELVSLWRKTWASFNLNLNFIIFYYFLLSGSMILELVSLWRETWASFQVFARRVTAVLFLAYAILIQFLQPMDRASCPTNVGAHLGH